MIDIALRADRHDAVEFLRQTEEASSFLSCDDALEAVARGRLAAKSRISQIDRARGKAFAPPAFVADDVSYTDADVALIAFYCAVSNFDATHYDDVIFPS